MRDGSAATCSEIGWAIHDAHRKICQAAQRADATTEVVEPGAHSQFGQRLAEDLRQRPIGVNDPPAGLADRDTDRDGIEQLPEPLLARAKVPVKVATGQ